MQRRNKQELDSRDRPLIGMDKAGIFATVATLMGAALAYSIGVGVELDGRIDHLEEDAKVLLTGDGRVAPSREGLESYYGLKALESRLERLEREVEHYH